MMPCKMGATWEQTCNHQRKLSAKIVKYHDKNVIILINYLLLGVVSVRYCKNFKGTAVQALKRFNHALSD